jgi:hypothetical protein
MKCRTAAACKYTVETSVGNGPAARRFYLKRKLWHKKGGMAVQGDFL